MKRSLALLPFLVSSLATAAVGVTSISTSHQRNGETVVEVNHQPPRQSAGTTTTASREVGAFERIELRSAENLKVTVGPKASVKLTGDSNLLDLISTRTEGGTLIVEAIGSYRVRAPIQVEVEVPSLSALAVEGSSDARVTGLSGEKFSLAIDGSGNVEVSGSVNKLEVELSGSGDARLSNLSARSVRAELNGSGNISLDASESLTAELNGSGNIAYRRGLKQVKSSINGSGWLREF